MPYVPLNLKPGATLKAEHLAHMENGIMSMGAGSGGSGSDESALAVAEEAKLLAGAAKGAATEAKNIADAAQTAADVHAAQTGNPHGASAADVGALPAIESDEHPGCYYINNDGTPEWINPPLVIGVEYRTVERHNGNNVYVKLLDFGQLPNATYKNVAHGISPLTGVVSVTGTTTEGTNYIPSKSDGANLDVYVNAANIRITTSQNWSGGNGLILIKYTKE